jgi:hypothetical protein
MKIRYEDKVGLSLILITLGVLLNILIRQTLTSNMEKNVDYYLKVIMNSTHEYIKYRLITNGSALNGEGLNEKSTYICGWPIYRNNNYK